MGQPEYQLMPTGQTSKPRRNYFALCMTYILCILVVFNVFGEWKNTGGQTTEPHNDGNEVFTDWDLITPSEELNWVPCFRSVDKDFLCSRLTLPMDYNRPLNTSAANPKVHIALLLLPGKNHSASTGFAESPLLVNPGGPGGSGTELVLRVGRALQTIVGSEKDVLGFDPRGIGASWPHADCFAPGGEADSGSVLRRLLWDIGTLTGGLPGTSNIATEQLVLRARGLSTLCGEQDAENSILRYSGTPNVAQDMLRIVEAWDRSSDKSENSAVQVRKTDDDLSELSSTKGKLVYWGFSYGTILGATFATMFPDKVGRMVLDGVVNSDSYFLGNFWLKCTEDTDKVVDKFQEYCHQARDRCKLYRKGDKVEDVKARYEAVLRSLADKSRVYALKGSMPVVISYSDIKLLMFTAAYQPLKTFEIVAIILDALYRDEDMGRLTPPTELAPLCGLKPKDLMFPSEGQKAVLCTDQRGLFINESRAALDESLKQALSVSSFGDCAFSVEAVCAGWEVKPVDPPSFKWDSFPLTETGPINTSYPLVFVSNTHDPVTPLSAGLKQVQKFVDAGFIEQISEGHCSISSISICSFKKIQAYFSEGVVPDVPVFTKPGSDSLEGKWTTCEVDKLPFDVLRKGQGGKSYSTQDMEILEAAQKVQSEVLAFSWELPGHRNHALKHVLRMDVDRVTRLFATE